MKSFKLHQVSPNDDELKVIDILVKNGQYIEVGQLIFEVEGQKAAFEIFSDGSGYFNTTLTKGALIEVNQDAYTISDEPFVQEMSSEIKKHTVLQDNQSIPNIKIKAPVDAVFEGPLVHNKITPPRTGKFRLLIIGAGRAFRQIEDALFNNPHFEIYNVMDDAGISSILRNKLDLDVLFEDYRAGLYDAAFVATGSNARRAKFIKELRSRDIKTCNVIHPSAVIANSVLLGENIFIGANVTVGAKVKIGSGVFISAQSNIEHHCSISDSVLVGPGVALSGSVNIGHSSIISAGVAVEPGVRSGKNVFIPLNIPVFDDLEDNYKFDYKSMKSMR